MPKAAFRRSASATRAARFMSTKRELDLLINATPQGPSHDDLMLAKTFLFSAEEKLDAEADSARNGAAKQGS